MSDQPTDVLVWSSTPLANEALAAGHAAYPAVYRSEAMEAEYERRTARPLPETGQDRDRAVENRRRYRTECDQARDQAVQLNEQWITLMRQLAKTGRTDLCEAIAASVWDRGIDWTAWYA